MKTLAVVKNDPYLEPVSDVITARHNLYNERLKSVCGGDIVDFANGYKYFGFQRSDSNDGWWLREWLPMAKHVYLFGDFNSWDRMSLPLTRTQNGVWEIFLPDCKYKDRVVNGTRYKLFIHGQNGWNERIDAYVRQAIETPTTHDFTASIYCEPFEWEGTNHVFHKQPLIYETHVGMSSEELHVASFDYFTQNIIPRIKAAGYNSIQFMAIAEHPYYGCFGYHVANFFAVSSRFGTPNDFRQLVKAAHKEGISVIIDLVHSHFVKNVNEGLNELDGSKFHYCKDGEEGFNPHWDSKNFDYSKSEVIHFLLSNIKYWIEEFKIDGFRFDGVTAMLYRNHGYQKFVTREDYFCDNINSDALCYLTLANKLIHSINKNIITIAEDVSGMPTLCSKIEDGGIGFDYRLTMSIPDYWIELLEQQDEQWDLHKLWKELNNRTPATKEIGYCESHDQAMVGDKTIAFRLMDSLMYTHMDNAAKNIIVDRGIALHKIIRLLTISTSANGYLNFMGNEFGHPEWIDFPRKENNFSYAHAIRQWSLVDNPFLKYGALGNFDRDMLSIIKRHELLDGSYGYLHNIDTDNMTLAFSRGGLLFVFNLHPNHSISDYKITLPTAGKYSMILNSDDIIYAGAARHTPQREFFTQEIDGQHTISIYNTSRSAFVLIMNNSNTKERD